MKYQPSYNRCVFNVNPILPIMTLLVPLILIGLMYLFMAISIIRNKIPVGRLLITTTVILVTGILVTIPNILMITINMKMPYKEAKIFTVTLYHANCVCNPLIYYIANPKIAPQIKEQATVRTKTVKKQLSRTLTRTVSGFNNIPNYNPVPSQDKDNSSSKRSEVLAPGQ